MAVESCAKQGRGLGGGWGQCSGPTGLEKALGPCPSALVSEGRGPHLGAQQAPRARVGGTITLCSPTPPGGPLLPASPDLPSATFLCPQHPRDLEGAWRAGDRPGSSADALGLSGLGNHPLSSPASPTGPLPPASPDLPSPRGAHLVWPPLLLPPRSPYLLQFTLGFLPSPWGSESPTSCRQAP